MQFLLGIYSCNIGCLILFQGVLTRMRVPFLFFINGYPPIVFYNYLVIIQIVKEITKISKLNRLIT